MEMDTRNHLCNKNSCVRVDLVVSAKVQELVQAEPAQHRISAAALLAPRQEDVGVEPAVLLVADHVLDPLPPQVRPRLLYHEQVAPGQEKTVAGNVESLPSARSEEETFISVDMQLKHPIG